MRMLYTVWWKYKVNVCFLCLSLLYNETNNNFNNTNEADLLNVTVYPTFIYLTA